MYVLPRFRLGSRATRALSKAAKAALTPCRAWAMFEVIEPGQSEARPAGSPAPGSAGRPRIGGRRRMNRFVSRAGSGRRHSELLGAWRRRGRLRRLGGRPTGSPHERHQCAERSAAHVRPSDRLTIPPKRPIAVRMAAHPSRRARGKSMVGTMSRKTLRNRHNRIRRKRRFPVYREAQ